MEKGAFPTFTIENSRGFHTVSLLHHIPLEEGYINGAKLQVHTTGILVHRILEALAPLERKIAVHYCYKITPDLANWPPSLNPDHGIIIEETPRGLAEILKFAAFYFLRPTEKIYAMNTFGSREWLWDQNFLSIDILRQRMLELSQDS